MSTYRPPQGEIAQLLSTHEIPERCIRCVAFKGIADTILEANSADKACVDAAYEKLAECEDVNAPDDDTMLTVQVLGGAALRHLERKHLAEELLDALAESAHEACPGTSALSNVLATLFHINNVTACRNPHVTILQNGDL